MNCCICGTVKNVGPYLDKIFSNIEQLGALFENYVIIFYYDHSNDNTLQKMKEYQQKVGQDKFIFYVNKVEVSQYRTIRIANARNGCLQLIREKFKDYPFFIMIDCDDKCSENVKPQVLQKYLRRNDWDSLSFNKNSYYDIWALSIRPYMFSCHHFHKNQTGVMHQYITKLLKEVPAGGLLKCASAFNGFAIYRTNKFLNCTYDGKFRLDLLPSNYLKKNIQVCKSGIFLGPEDCEHRSFHMQAIQQNGARIRISPEIVF
jgi:hypothetical protein